jgi:hypothetical protein
MAAVALFGGSAPACSYRVHPSDALGCNSQVASAPESPLDPPTEDLSQGQQDSLESCQIESRGELDANWIVVQQLASSALGMPAIEWYSICVDRPDHLITLPGPPPPAIILG